MSQEVIEITEREIEVVEVIEKGLIGPTGPTGPQANINYTVVTANQTLSNSQNIAADTSGGSFTLTLPASPNAGDSIDIFDYANTFDTNPLTIARNGQNIESLAENLTANVEGAYFTLIYTGVTRGWQILPRYGVSGIEDVLSAEGDLLYRGASSETRLPIGTAGQVLKVNSGATAPEWGSISGSISVTGSDLTLSGATGTPITNATIANDAVSNAKLSNMAQSTIKGRATASTGDPEDLSASQVRTILNVADGAEVNVQSNWTEANSGSDAFILNKPTLGTAAAAATTDFAAAVHTHAASDVTTGTFDNARINFAAPSSIGSTTPTTGTFTTLTANNGTLAASAPVLDLAQTWNNAAVTFRGVNWSFVETAAGGSSEVLRISTGAAGTNPIFNIRRDGNATFANAVNVGVVNGNASIAGQGGQWRVASDGFFSWTNGVGNAYGTSDLALRRDAAGTLAQYNGANAQAYNIYNTFTSATNHERGFLKWRSNVFQIGTEKGSGSPGGTARNLEFQTDGATRFYITTGGNFVVGNGDGTTQASAAIVWQGNARINATNTSTGVITLGNRDNNGFNRLQFGGTTASFPALKRDSTVLQARLANDSDFCPLQGQLRIHQNAVSETITATHTLTLFDAAGTAYKVPCVAA
jgi:hypothetical protein